MRITCILLLALSVAAFAKRRFELPAEFALCDHPHGLSGMLMLFF